MPHAEARPQEHTGSAGAVRSVAAEPAPARGRRPDWLLVAALAPVVASIVGYAVQGWVAAADPAMFGLRARDVLGPNNPLVGAYASSPGVTDTTPVHHPGPILAWLLAPFVRVFGFDLGLLIGAGVVNGAGLATIWWAARRSGDRRIVAALIGATLFAAVSTMGPGGLGQPLNQVLCLVPFAAIIVLGWRVSVADWAALVPLAIAASWVLQLHLPWLITTVAVLIASAVGAVLTVRQGAPGPSRRQWSGAAVLVMVLWSMPVVDAVTRRGGNLRALVEFVTADFPTQGVRLGLQAVASIVTLPPNVLAFPNTDAPFGRLNVTTVVIAPLAIAGVLRVRRSGGPIWPLLRIVLFAVAGAFVAATTLPAEPVEYFQILWIKVVTPFVWTVVILGLVLDRRPEPRAVLRWRGALAIGLLVVMAAAPLPIRALDADSFVHDAIPPLADQIDAALPEGGTWMVAGRGGNRYQITTWGLLARLESKGRDVLFEPGLSAYFGQQRAVREGDQVDGVLYLLDARLPAPEGAEKVAEWRQEGISDSEVAEVYSDVAAHARANPPLEITGEGLDVLGERLTGRGTPEEIESYRADPSRLLDAPPELVAQLYRSSAIASPLLPADLERRLFDLQDTALAVYLLPADFTLPPY